jgi:hypothetical protein
VKIKVIENFQAFDEYRILMNILVVAGAGALSLVFAWFGGLVAVGCFVVAMVGSSIIERTRKTSMNSIEKNDMDVNARLLVIIKNGVKVKMMGEMAHERTELNTLKESYDGPRRTDFCRDPVA